MHQSQFAGNYVADQKGYYEDEGLKVTLLPFDYEHFPIEEVINGQADFGITGADELITARSQGKKVKALAVIYQENPIVAYALESSGIKNPIDFIGKRIGMEQGVNVEAVIHAMLASQGINYQKDIEEIRIDYDATPLIEGKVDIATGYITNEPIQAEEAGYKVNIIAPYKYGIKLYADVLFTTEEMIETKPEIIQGFVQATLKGWEYALSHQDEAVKYTMLYEDPNNISLNEPHQKALLENSVPFIKPTAGSKIGEMNFSVWSSTYKVMKDFDAIEGETDVRDVYTTQFLAN